MRIGLNDSKVLIVNSKEELLLAAIGIYSSLFVDKKYRLRDRELDFFIGCVLAFHANIGLNSEEFTEFMKNERNFSDSEDYIRNMKYTLRKQRWLKPIKKGFELPQFFKQDLCELEVNLKLKLGRSGNS